MRYEDQYSSLNIKNVPVTVKVDVYSFGVVLLEIICCRKSVAMECGEEKAILTDWAYDCYMEGRLDTLVDNDEAAMSDITMLRRWKDMLKFLFPLALVLFL
ncbi:hypothetical protein CsSME_00050043 [Camellia sinensis var. sinensis]